MENMGCWEELHRGSSMPGSLEKGTRADRGSSWKMNYSEQICGHSEGNGSQVSYVKKGVYKHGQVAG